MTQAYLTLSEVLGHIDLLLNEGRVREVEQDGVVHFEATETIGAGRRRCAGFRRPANCRGG